VGKSSQEMYMGYVVILIKKLHKVYNHPWAKIRPNLRAILKFTPSPREIWPLGNVHPWQHDNISNEKISNKKNAEQKNLEI
jgi:hypothetical protein